MENSDLFVNFRTIAKCRQSWEHFLWAYHLLNDSVTIFLSVVSLI